jgi:hypothetical protein
MVRGFMSVALVVVGLSSATRARAEPLTPGRNVVPVEATHGPPPGFHYEERPRQGAIIAGGIVAGAGALLLLEGVRQRATGEGGSGPGGGGELLMLVGGAHLAVGIPLLAYGLLSPRAVYVRDAVAQVSLDFAGSARHLQAGVTIDF